METKQIILLICAAVVPYLVCGINPAILLSSLMYHKDIRTLGSKNPGFTNFKRVFGGKYAWLVFTLDIGKAALVCALSGIAFSSQFGLFQLGAAYAGFFAMLGHCYPVWYGFNGGKGFLVSSRYVPQAIGIGFLLAAVLIALLYWYFGTEQGSALRATGSNPAMSRAQGINIDRMKVIGLALSNGVVALSGGLMTQFQGTADVNMGRGAIVIGLASIVIGEVFCEAIFKKGCNFSVKLLFIVLGGVLYYMVMTLILWLRLDPNDLKLFTALIVALFLAVPYLQKQSKSSFSRAKKRGQKEAIGQ